MFRFFKRLFLPKEIKAKIRSAKVLDDELCISIETQMAKVIADHMSRLLKEQKAPNYVEMQMINELGEVIIVTVRFGHGKTPHELRIEAEEKLKIAEEKLRMLEINLLNKVEVGQNV